MAALAKSMDCLKYYIAHYGFNVHDPIIIKAVLQRFTREYGNCLDCLQYIDSLKYAFPGNVCNMAARHNRVECLEYLHRRGFVCNDVTMIHAIAGNSLACLKYLHDTHASPKNNTQLCEVAVNFVRLDCLKFLHENGYEWDTLMHTKNATRTECYQCLQYAFDNGFHVISPLRDHLSSLMPARKTHGVTKKTRQ